MAGHSKPGMLVTTAQAARLIGMSGRTFARLVEAGVFVAVVPGQGRKPAQFDAAAVVAAHVARQEERSSALDLEQQRARLAREQRRKLERESLVACRALLPRDQVVREGSTYIAAVQARLRGITPRAVGLGLIAESSAVALENLVEEAISEMAGWQTEQDLLAALPAVEVPNV